MRPKEYMVDDTLYATPEPTIHRLGSFLAVPYLVDKVAQLFLNMSPNVFVETSPSTMVDQDRASLIGVPSKDRFPLSFSSLFLPDGLGLGHDYIHHLQTSPITFRLLVSNLPIEIHRHDCWVGEVLGWWLGRVRCEQNNEHGP